MEQIEKHEYNLNISRYVSTAKEEEKIDLKKVNDELTALEANAAKAAKTHNQYLEELGLPPLP